MKKKLITITLCIIALALTMFAEYRYIMCNITPYYVDDGTIYLEFMGQVDEYCTEVEEQEE